MSDTKDDLKTVGLFRKALLPVLKKLADDQRAETDARFKLLEDTLQKITDKESVVNVSPTEVTVPEPKVTVTVEVPEELTKAIQAQNEAIQKIQDRKVIVKSEAPIEKDNWQPHDQGKQGVYRYSGFVRSDGSWYIQRIAKNEQRYAKGTGNYSEAWEKKKDQKYGYIGG